ncbi:hypothetical protein [Serratia sp. Ag2]|uniref:hypothetical protein n=1 Tax=Serratia sp. Ag2 TaxID=1532556 RepID=UPI000504FC27|nr:hypothetical protein [Serratia sp. Ag2]KFK91766.1 peptidase [Serratia sp. Ag2]
MNLLHIFKAGTHTDMHGQKLQFSDADIQAMAAAYDPALHEAPIVVGHPKTDDPAYGWVKSLAATGKDMLAEPHQVDPAFKELVDNHRFKKISAAFYAPDSPGNPVPGVYYLRHVGFLGAQPPAVKGLKSAEFGEANEGVVEFADWGFTTSATLFSRLRDFMIEQFGLEKADEALPPWQLEALREAANPPGKPHPAFSDPAAPAAPTETPTEETPVDEEEKLRLQQENADLKRQLDERKQAELNTKLAATHDANVAFADTLITEARLAPAGKSVIVALLDAVSQGDKPVEFAEGTTTQPLADAFKSLLQSASPVVEFSEVATGERRRKSSDGSVEFADADPDQLALHQKALTLSKSENISYEAAVKRCL